MQTDIDLKKIENKDYQGIRKALEENPGLANEGVSLSRDDTRKAHPLHRICDAVFSKKITDEEAIEIAKIFLHFGANINGDKLDGRDTPLLAAASLHAEQLGIFYIDNGADVHYISGNDGETALHWAAYCGRDKLVERLIQAEAGINLHDRSYNGTPVDWAVHALMKNDLSNLYHQQACVKLLFEAGADVSSLDAATIKYLHGVAKDGAELLTT